MLVAQYFVPPIRMSTCQCGPKVKADVCTNTILQKSRDKLCKVGRGKEVGNVKRRKTIERPDLIRSDLSVEELIDCKPNAGGGHNYTKCDPFHT